MVELIKALGILALVVFGLAFLPVAATVTGSVFGTLMGGVLALLTVWWLLKIIAAERQTNTKGNPPSSS